MQAKIEDDTQRIHYLLQHSSKRFTTIRQLIWVCACLTVGATCSGLTADAHGPTPHKIDETVEVAAKPEAVWALIADFPAISKWHPSVAASVPREDPVQGKLRVLTLASGANIVDGLTEYDPAKMTYSYRRVDDDVKALPVSSYTATITVEPAADGGTKVEWIGRYYRGDTGNEPPEDLNDEAAEKAMTEFFQTGLHNLKFLAERKG